MLQGQSLPFSKGLEKVSCVTNMVMAYSFLRKADDAIQEVEDLFKARGVPSKPLGDAGLPGLQSAGSGRSCAWSGQDGLCLA